jgi:hypothetical protein
MRKTKMFVFGAALACAALLPTVAEAASTWH